jgi:hypothetical protein
MTLSNYTEPIPGFFIYDDVFLDSKNFIEELELETKKRNLNWGFGGTHNSYGEKVIDLSTRNVFSISIPFESDQNDLFLLETSNKLKNLFTPYEKYYKEMFHLETKTHEPYLVLKYRKGQYFNNHLDDHIETPRRMSLIYYCNDDYEGGEIEFSKFNLTIRPKANQLFLFPSSYVYQHKVLPITGGVRYAIVSFVY